MVSDTEARNAMRALMKIFDSTCEQYFGLAYVLAKRDRHRYERLLEAAEIATKTVIQPLKEADTEHSQVYKALDDPDADWTKAVMAMLNQGRIEFTGNQAIERLELMQGLEARFEEEMKRRYGSDARGNEE